MFNATAGSACRTQGWVAYRDWAHLPPPWSCARARVNEAGYEVMCASTPVEALRLARSQTFDLYLLDQWLGGDETGVELCAQLRQFDAQTPIVFFSGLAHECDRERALAAGAQAYLIKPNDIDALACTVGRLLTESRVSAYV